jgi:hypothetical protein
MFKLEIETDNDAFHPDARLEVTSILRGLVKRIDEGETDGKLRDSNGNTVGSFALTSEDSAS